MDKTAVSSVIIGIDPGLVNTGWAVLKTNGGSIMYVASGVIKTSSQEPLPVRLLKINAALLEIANSYQPTSAAIEETYVNKNYGSSLKLAHARGAAIVTIASCGLAVAEYSAKKIKKTVSGTGTADKTQIERMLSLLFPNVILKSPDEADAMAIALCHAMHFKGLLGNESF